MSDYTKKLLIADILVRIELDAMTDNDQEILHAWLAESQSNREFYERVIRGESLSNYEAFDAKVDVAGLVKEIQLSIHKRKKKRITMRIISTATAVSAAAVLAIGIFLPYFYGDSGQEDPIMNKELAADRIHAILSLPDGRQVGLNREDDEGRAWRQYAERDINNAKQYVAEAPVEIRVDIPRGGEYKMRLDDGTTVWLNSESSMVFPKEFQEDRRSVTISGEAYFEVNRDEQRPFIVVVGDSEIRVLGTTFNITAYEDSGSITTTLVSGSVEVVTPLSTATLIPGNQAVVTSGSANIEVTMVDTRLYCSWTTGVFVFEKMKLADICTQLTRWYDVDFVFEGNTGEEKFTGGARKSASLGHFLSNIELVTDVSFKEDSGKIVIMPK